ncbi:hydroxyethylthiazole kinase [Desulfocurvus sp. DL9XJH121]
MDTASIYADLEKVRAAAPLVHNITNFVAMNNTANALLCLGASPIMAHAIEELDDLIAISGSLVLNIGTLSPMWIESMIEAGIAAQKRGVPVLLDPVGAGASSLRTVTALSILRECAPAVIRGNASEILALCTALDAASPEHLRAAASGNLTGPKGVDSAHSGEGLVGVARDLATCCDCAVVVSGPVDIVADSEHCILVKGGSALMPKVTAMGCTASAVVGAFAAVEQDPLRAAVSGMAVMSAAGDAAGKKAEGPGTLQLHFYDALYNLDAGQIASSIVLEEV